ncbi:MAG: M20 family peptidase [Cytophagaceae bacterium]
MKKALFFVLAAFIFFLVYLVTNALLISSRQLKVPQAEFIQPDAEAVLNLSKAVQFKTISHQGVRTDTSAFLSFHTFLECTFPKAHAALKKEKFGLSLLYIWEGKDPSLKPILLMAHQDVVPEEGEWEIPAFEGNTDNEFIHGRGTLDDKSGILGILQATEYLIEKNFRPERTIYFAFGHDEETGGKSGNAQIAEDLQKRNIRFEYVLDEGGSIINRIMPGIDKPLAVVGIAEKGYTSVELTVESEGGHSSMPPANTAIGILSKAISRLEEKPFRGRIRGATEKLFQYSGPEMGFGNRIVFANYRILSPIIKKVMSGKNSTNASIRTTMAATVIEGGVKENVLPTRAKAIVNLRTLPGDSLTFILDHLEKTIKDDRVKLKVLPNHSDPTPVSSTEAESFVKIQTTIHEVFPEALVSPYLVLATTDSKHYIKLTDNTYRFLPLLLEKSDLERIHGKDERISIDNYKRLINFYIRLLEKN